MSDPRAGRVRCICPILDVAYHGIGRKRRDALVIFPLTTCPEHSEYGVLPESPPWWPRFPTLATREEPHA